MTKLGKALVLLNLVVSFCLLAWSLSLLANRIDWSEQKAQGDQPSGEMFRRQARIEELWSAVRPAEAAWRGPRHEIVALEKQRRDDRAWYAAEFLHIRNVADAGKPARKVVFDRGVPAVDPAAPSRPRMETALDIRSRPLLSLASYDKELSTASENLAAELKKHTDLVDEDSALTLRLVGKPGEKGLRQRIIDERAKYQDLDKEEELTKPMLINAYVDSQLILQRAEALKARLSELERLSGKGVAVEK